MSALPEVLAGPIVRRVEPRLCSFWIALSHPASVMATVWRGLQTAGAEPGTVASGDDKVAEAITTTLPIARRLHVAVVTIKLDMGEPSFEPGQIYAYDIQVVTPTARKGLKQLRLLEAETMDMEPDLSVQRPLGLPLGYVEGRLPSIVTAPALAENVRMAHCSCRKSYLAGPRRPGLARRHDRGEPDRPDRAPAAAVPHRRPDLRRRLLRRPAGDAQRPGRRSHGCHGAAAGHDDAAERHHDRPPVRRRPAQLPGGPPSEGRDRARWLHDRGRREPPAQLRRVRRDVPRRLEPARLARAGRAGADRQRAGPGLPGAPVVLEPPRGQPRGRRRRVAG